MNYRPYPGSLASLVIGFFTLNPDEELGLDDVISKFVSPGDSRNVHTQLAPALDNELLDYDAKTGNYRLGLVPMPSVLEPKSSEREAVVHRRPATSKTAAPEPTSTQSKQLRPAWSEEESDLLRQQYPILSTKELVELFGRPLESIYNKAYKMGLKKEKRASPPATTPQQRKNHDPMDGKGNSADAPVLPNIVKALDDANDQPLGASDPGKSQPNGFEENQSRQGCAQRQAGGVREGGQTGGAADPQSNEYGQPEKGLEAGGHDRMGSNPWPGTAWVHADADKSESAKNNGQSGSVHPSAALSTNHDKQLATGSSRLVSVEGADQPGGQPLGENAASPIAVVRQHLLDTLMDLRSKTAPMAIDRARAVAEVAAVIVNFARVEVDYIKATQQRRGAFFESPLELENQGVSV